MSPNRTRHALAAIWAACLLAALMGPATPALAAHGTGNPSTGTYRIPYVDGTSVTVTNDHHNHGSSTPNNGNNRIDMVAGTGTPIIAAASGWIHGSDCQRPGEVDPCIIDHHGNAPGAGDGLAADGITPQNDTLEHTCGNNNPVLPTDPPNPIVGTCAQHNNYVWIEHPNGEWTKYTHFGTGTVTAQGWVDGAWVNAGEVLGLEGDVGQATNLGGGIANHLHFEVAVPNNPANDLTWNSLGGGITNGQNLIPTVCDVPNNVYVDSTTDPTPGANQFTANPCNHLPPTADAGGPYVVDEGSSVQFNGVSTDPEGNPLTYAWSPDNRLDDPTIAQPTYFALDDTVDVLILRVYDQIEQLRSTDFATVTVQNVAPTVTAVGDAIDEAGTATVSATIEDPGADSHTATIDWGDGSPDSGPVLAATLALGVDHVYGDNGDYTVTVTVSDDDGGIGVDTAPVSVSNLDPTVVLDTNGAVAFPGGDFLVVDAGAELPSSADGSDPGSDDLTFSWSTGDQSTYFNNGVDADPLPSPFGTFPFQASDEINASYAVPGAESLVVTLTDDDEGEDSVSAGVLVTGTADDTEGEGWWKHQFAQQGAPQVDSDTLAGYLEIVRAASSVFAEQTALAAAGDAHAVLSPTGGDARAKAEASLLVAWLQFASGAVDWDATVPLNGEQNVGYLDLLFTAESVILDDTASTGQLHAVELDLNRVRHAA